MLTAPLAPVEHGNHLLGISFNMLCNMVCIFWLHQQQPTGKGLRICCVLCVEVRQESTYRMGRQRSLRFCIKEVHRPVISLEDFYPLADPGGGSTRGNPHQNLSKTTIYRKQQQNIIFTCLSYFSIEIRK